MATAFALERDSLLRYFHLVGERAGELLEFLNPLFGGRDEELAQLHENVRNAVAGALINRTVVVHGAPGAGKSELKAQFLSHIPEMHKSSKVLPIAADLADVGDAAHLLRSLLSQLPDDLKRVTAVSQIVNELGDIKSITALGFGFTRGQRERQPESTAQYAQRLWFGAQVDRLPSEVKEFIFVLCVDEFQGLDNPSQSLCSALHEGTLGLRIVPVYFGLSDALDVLRNANISRILQKNSIALSSLETDASEDILRAFCECLDIDFSSHLARDRVISEVAAVCDCWPHHLVSWMRAACAVLPTHNFALTADALQETNEICTQYRREYYGDRVRGPSALRSENVSQAFGDLLHNRTIVGKGEIILALRPALERVHREFDIDKFVEEAIHSGVLEREGMGRYRVPIPSLADYIYEESRPIV